MKKLFFILSLLFSVSLFAQNGRHGEKVSNQNISIPNTTYGIANQRTAGLKGMFFPAGCGRPDTTYEIPNNAQTLAAFYLDTCGNILYRYNPHLGWDTVRGGSGNGTSYTQDTGIIIQNGKIRTNKNVVVYYAPTRISGANWYTLPDGSVGERLATAQEWYNNGGNQISGNAFVTTFNPDGITSYDSATGTLGYNLASSSLVFNNRVGFRDSSGFAQYKNSTGAWMNIGSSTSAGTVTAFSFTNANGITGTVTNASTTPNLTLALGTITPSSVTTTGNVAAGGYYFGSNFFAGTSGNNVYLQTPLNGGGSVILNNSAGSAQNLVINDAGSATVRTNFTANGTITAGSTVTGAYVLANAATAPYFGTPGALFTRTAANTLALGNAQGDRSGTLLAGVGNFNGTNPLFLSGVQATSTLSSDSVVTINAGVIKKAPFSSFASTNIYNSDGSLTGDRTVDLNDHSFAITGAGGNAFIFSPNDHYTIYGNGGDDQQYFDFVNHAFYQYVGDASSFIQHNNDFSFSSGTFHIGNLAGQGPGIVGVDNDGLLSWQAGQHFALPGQDEQANEDRNFSHAGFLFSISGASNGKVFFGEGASTDDVPLLTIQGKDQYTSFSGFTGKINKYGSANITNGDFLIGSGNGDDNGVFEKVSASAAAEALPLLSNFHPVSTGGTPIISDDTPGNLTSIAVTGTDHSMTVTVVVASGQVVTGSLATITFSSTWAATPRPSISASNPAAAGTAISAGSTDTATITLNAFGLTTGTYEYNIKTDQ